MERSRRWVLYAASEEDSLSRFGEAVANVGSDWKPVAVDPFKLDEAVKVIEPEMIVVAARTPADDALLRRAFALHGRRRLVIDDRQLPVVSKLLGAAPSVW